MNSGASRRHAARAAEHAKGLVWHALWVAAGKEHAAQKLLMKKGLTTFVPIDKRWRRRNRYTRDKRLIGYPLVPRYIFTGFETEPQWWYLLQLPYLTSVVGLNGCPLRLCSDQMADFIGRYADGLTAPKEARHMISNKEFKQGDNVEIIGGPFQGRMAPVREISGANAKLILDLLGGETKVSVPLELLQAA